LGRHIRWQAIITFTGIALTLTFLGLLAFSRRTITVPDVAGAYTEGIAGAPQLINPLLSQYNRVDQDLSALIFNGLTRADGAGDVKPDLAKSWEVSDDGLAYLFRLREDVLWQDNEPFTADDVVFTISLMQDPEFPGVPDLGKLWRTVTVLKLDDHTIRFILPEPFPAFVDSTTIGILPEHLLMGVSAGQLISHPFNLSPIGTGPFKLEEITTEYARLSANPFYSGPQPQLANLRLRFYPSYQAAIAAYQAEEVQGIGFVPPQAIPTVQSLDSLNLYTTRLSGYTIIYLNLRTPETAPFFAEAGVRQALLYALDRQAIIDQALYGQGLVAAGPIRSWSWAYNPEVPAAIFDPVKANMLLDEAGWIDSDGDGIRDKEGRPFAFTLLTNETPEKIAVAEIVSQQWQQVGVAVTVEIVGAGLGERLDQRNYQAALAEVLLSGDPDPYPLWHRAQISSGQNYAGWDNERASQLLEAARTITNTGQRSDFYFEFQRIFAEEVPSIILFHPVYTYAVSQDIQDVQLAPMNRPSDRFRTITDWYLLTRQVIYSESQFPDPVRQSLDEDKQE
jgi:peptide/nickel transport system substrate-binding protein